jgi:hypothetical protein
MASTIIPNVPEEGFTYRQKQRENWNAARAEILALQAAVATLQASSFPDAANFRTDVLNRLTNLEDRTIRPQQHLVGTTGEIPFFPACSNYAPSTEQVTWEIDENYRVTLRGIVTFAISNPFIPLYELPLEARPPLHVIRNGINNNNAVRIDISVAGIVSANGATAGWLSMPAIEYYAKLPGA